MATANTTDNEILRLVAQKSKAANKGAKAFSSRLIALLDELHGLSEDLSSKIKRDRIRDLLSTLQNFVQAKTSVAVSLPLGSIVLLLASLCSVDEKIKELPDIHAAIFRVAETVCVRLGNAAKSVHKVLLEYIAWIFRHERHSEGLREASYGLVAHVLELSGTGLPKETIQQLGLILEACCADIVLEKPSEKTVVDIKTGLLQSISGTSKNQNTNSDDESVEESELQDAATDLLVAALGNVPFEFLSRSIRARLERTAVLTNNSAAMLAATLNTAPNTPFQKSNNSLLPFLARADPKSPAVESLVRPRMPQVSLTSTQVDQEDDRNNDEDEHIALERTTDPSDVPFDQVSVEEAQVTSQTQDASSSEQPVNTETPLESASGVTFALPRPQTVDTTDLQPTEAIPQQTPHLETTITSPGFAASRKRLSPDPSLEDSESKRIRFDENRSIDSIGSGQPPNISEAPRLAGQSLPASAIGKEDIEGRNDDDDDDDDFVIPPLTMEQDTEDEEEAEVD